jgi:hypothetical protein
VQQPVVKPPTKAGFRPFSLFFLFLLFFLIWHFYGPSGRPGALGGSGFSLSRPLSRPLLTGSVGVQPRQIQYWKFEVSPTMTNAHVSGSFRASGGSGNDIEAFAAEWSECEKWINGHQANLVYASGKATNGTIEVPISVAGTYGLAFSNRRSLISAKTVTGNVALEYLLP